jgi:hypothetical protein
LSVGGGGGPEIAGTLVGSFSEGDKNGKIGLCHVRSVLGKKQNMSFSFDPASMSCKNCPGRGEHSLVGGAGGGGCWRGKLLCSLTRTSPRACLVPRGNA